MYDSVWTFAMGLDKFLYHFDVTTGSFQFPTAISKVTDFK